MNLPKQLTQEAMRGVKIVFSMGMRSPLTFLVFSIMLLAGPSIPLAENTAPLASAQAAPDAREFDAPPYIHDDGAITVHARGLAIDPYFATKSLLTAHSAGLDISRVGKRWIEWLRPRQKPDGSFDRYQQNTVGGWESVAPADADDAILALWIELLYSLAPDAGMPAEWQPSVTRALSLLQSLRDPKTGIYVVSHTTPVGLLMDNVEVYGALKNIARHQQRLGYAGDARYTTAQANILADAINRVFWDAARKEYTISTQPTPRGTFYPHAVAQLYPLLKGMPTPLISDESPGITYQRWLDDYRTDWLDMTSDHYPWGLVALTGWQLGIREPAASWQTVATPFRHGERWNILEEAVMRVFEAQTLPTP